MKIEELLGGATSNEFYNSNLTALDASVCEALAVGQAIGHQIAKTHIGYSTHIFTRICSHATSLIRAVPRSRWARADFEDWDFGCAAGHCRAIIEGFLLFCYLIEEPGSIPEWSAKLNVMHLNDCTRRIKLMENLGASDDLDGFRTQSEELKGRLRNNEWFTDLQPSVQKRSLAGDNLMIPNRDEMLEKVGWDKKSFYSTWDLLSQYAHVLPVSFYRIEPNGRGTGIENDCDKCYIAVAMQMSAVSIVIATDLLVEAFPGTAEVRKGTKSKFSPGPRANRRPLTARG
ncbi:hypothetical protein V0M98_37100 (plasmid) [Pseudomonas silesiensis]|uniref:hypothetical protein n=1 Tax=Pseudomonas silesiensis TaxID=1853130 RepID=UPI0030D33183